MPLREIAGGVMLVSVFVGTIFTLRGQYNWRGFIVAAVIIGEAASAIAFVITGVWLLCG